MQNPLFPYSPSDVMCGIHARGKSFLGYVRFTIEYFRHNVPHQVISTRKGRITVELKIFLTRLTDHTDSQEKGLVGSRNERGGKPGNRMVQNSIHFSYFPSSFRTTFLLFHAPASRGFISRALSKHASASSRFPSSFSTTPFEVHAYASRGSISRTLS
jgi:hypothetical protein